MRYSIVCIILKKIVRLTSAGLINFVSNFPNLLYFWKISTNEFNKSTLSSVEFATFPVIFSSKRLAKVDVAEV